MTCWGVSVFRAVPGFLLLVHAPSIIFLGLISPNQPEHENPWNDGYHSHGSTREGVSFPSCAGKQRNVQEVSLYIYRYDLPVLYFGSLRWSKWLNTLFLV